MAHEGNPSTRKAEAGHSDCVKGTLDYIVSLMPSRAINQIVLLNKNTRQACVDQELMRPKSRIIQA